MSKKLSDVYKSKRNIRPEAMNGYIRATLKQTFKNYIKYVQIIKGT